MPRLVVPSVPRARSKHRSQQAGRDNFPFLNFCHLSPAQNLTHIKNFSCTQNLSRSQNYNPGKNTKQSPKDLFFFATCCLKQSETQVNAMPHKSAQKSTRLKSEKKLFGACCGLKTSGKTLENLWEHRLENL